MERLPRYSSKDIDRVRRGTFGVSGVGSLGITLLAGTPLHIVSIPDHIPDTDSPSSLNMHLTFPICFYAHDRRGPFLNFHPAPKVCKNIFPILSGYSLAWGRLSARTPFLFLSPVSRQSPASQSGLNSRSSVVWCSGRILNKGASNKTD
jgi:hypothetical protein